MGKVNIKQLNVAPASGYVIGSGAGGVPIWKLEVSSVAWNQITGNQADINLSGFTNNAGFITLGSLSAGTGISYDNLTGVITNSSPASNITASEGLTRTLDDITLGGSYTTNREIVRGGNAWVRISDEATRVKSSEVFNVTNILNSTNAGYLYQNSGNMVLRTYLRFGGTEQSFTAASGPATFGRLMFSANTALIDRQGSSGADFPQRSVLAAYYAYIFPTNIGSSTTLYPDLLLYGGGASPTLSGTNKIVNSITMFGARAYNANATATINSIYGATVGFNETTNRKGATRNIGFGVYFNPSVSTANGLSQNSIMDDFVEQSGDFAFYDQTGWNNYFKGSLGLGNSVPVSKLDVTGDINTTVGFKISGAATLGNYLRGNGTNFVSSALTASDLAANSITDGLIRQSAGLSVIGRSTNSTGNVADITAGTDLHVLRRSGTSIGFGLLTLGSISATNNQLFYGVGGVAGQSANMTYDGTTATFTSGFNSVSNITNGVNYTGTSTAVANAAYGVKYAQTLTANASINHSITGVQFSPTLVASSNFNFLYGAQLDPTFTVGAFTGVTTIPLQIIERSTTGQTIRLQNATAGASNGILLADNLNGQRINISYIGSTGLAYINLNGASANTFNYSSVNLQIQNAFVTRATYFHNTGYYSHTPANSSITSGTASSHSINQTFAPTSGTGVHNWLDLNGIINQTGGANGITRGLYVNNTVTAAADYRAIETTAGKTILGGATGSLSVGNSAFTAANGVINATTGYRVNNAATSGSTLMGDGTNFVPATRAQFLGYKEYVALLSQTAIGDNPTVLVQSNDIGAIVWTYSGGLYTATLSGAFTEFKTSVIFTTQSSYNDGGMVNLLVTVDNNTVNIEDVGGGGLEIQNLFPASVSYHGVNYFPITIRVYN